jgi:hypothetical protein
MGQEYLIVNFTKQQYLDPRNFAESRELPELMQTSCGALAGLALLLAEENDGFPESKYIGYWMQDTVCIVPDSGSGYFELVEERYVEISSLVLPVLAANPGIAETLSKRGVTYAAPKDS